MLKKQIKHYKLEAKLGSGGMGEVYKAYDTVLERPVAIKVMHPHLLEDELNDTRFMLEARIAAKLVHPNVVTIHEIGKAKVGRFIVMEFVNGDPLTNLLRNKGAFKPKQAIKLIIQTLNGLQHAHSMGILHRDIKSDNILVTGQGNAKILDFGIAKIATQNGLTMAGDLLGTVEYMSPEQLLGESIDHRSDIYAVGIVLYQLLTNKLPFSDASPAAILYHKLNEEPTPPSFYNDNIKKDLEQVVLKAINKNKEDRWNTAEDFSKVLEGIIKNDFESEYSIKKEPTNAAEELDIDTEVAEADDTLKLCPVFIGREKEFKKLVHHFTQSSHGQGKTVIIKGEAGIGKSTLAEHMQNYARHRKAWVLSGACLYQEGMDAYLPYIDALRQFLSRENHNLTEEERLNIKEIVRDKLPILLEFTERFATTFGPSPVQADQTDESNKVNLFEGIYKLISYLATKRPVVLIIDDLQWADEASLRLFHYISRYVEQNRLMLLGISRTDRYDLQKNGKPGMLLDVLARIRREGHYEQINLNRLNQDVCEVLIDKSLSPNLFTDEFYRRIFLETKGNPLYVTETLKQLRENNGIFFKEGIWYNKDEDLELVVPHRVEDVFIRRLSGLNSEERELLQVAAVQGCKFDVSMISQLLEIPKIKLLKILQHIEQELEIITSTERSFQFEHPMMRDLLYNEIPPALKREYHLVIAEEFEKMYGQDFGALVGDVAQHYRRGDNHRKAIPLLYQAGVRAFGLSAYREASLFFEDLIKSVAKSGQTFPESISQTDLYFKLGISHEESGCWEQGMNAYKKLLEYSEKSECPKGQTDALLRIGRIHGKLGEWESALSNYENCLKIARKHAVSNVLSRVYNNIGIIYFQKGDFDQAMKYFDQTLQNVDNEMGEFDKAHAFTNIGIIANIRGECSTSLENYQKALIIYERKGNRQDLARIHHNIGMTLSDKGEWEEAIKVFHQCLKLSDEVEDKQLRALTYLNLGKTYVRQNQFDLAKELTEKAVKFFKRADDTLNVAEAYHIFGLIYGQQKEYSTAEKYLKDSIRINEQLEYQEGLAETYVSFGLILRNKGDTENAKKHFTKAIKIYKKLNLENKIEEIKKIVDKFNIDYDGEVKVVDIEMKQSIPTKKYVAKVHHSR